MTMGIIEMVALDVFTMLMIMLLSLLFHELGHMLVYAFHASRPLHKLYFRWSRLRVELCDADGMKPLPPLQAMNVYVGGVLLGFSAWLLLVLSVDVKLSVVLATGVAYSVGSVWDYKQMWKIALSNGGNENG